MSRYAPASQPVVPGWITIELWGLVATARVVAVGVAASAPIRRLLNATPPGQIIMLTGGQQRETVLVLDSGHLVITPLQLSEVAARLAAAVEE